MRRLTRKLNLEDSFFNFYDLVLKTEIANLVCEGENNLHIITTSFPIKYLSDTEVLKIYLLDWGPNQTFFAYLFYNGKIPQRGENGIDNDLYEYALEVEQREIERAKRITDPKKQISITLETCVGGVYNSQENSGKHYESRFRREEIHRRIGPTKHLFRRRERGEVDRTIYKKR